MSGYDILNIENPHFQTIRKVIHKDDIQSNKAYQDAIVKQDCQACLNMPDEVFTDDFYKGYAVCEQNYFEGIYRYFEEEHFINREDLDVVFRVRDGASTSACEGVHYAKSWLKNYQMLNFIVGKKISNRIIMYVKAGPAMGKSEKYFGTHWIAGCDDGVEGTKKSLDIGYNIGLDGVFLITKNIGLKLGYNFIDLGNTDVWGGGKDARNALSTGHGYDLKYSFDNVYHNYVAAIKYFF